MAYPTRAAILVWYRTDKTASPSVSHTTYYVVLYSVIIEHNSLLVEW